MGIEGLKKIKFHYPTLKPDLGIVGVNDYIKKNKVYFSSNNCVRISNKTDDETMTTKGDVMMAMKYLCFLFTKWLAIFMP